MGKIVDVKSIVEKKKEKLKVETQRLQKKGIIPKLTIIHANDLDASKIYISNKRKLCAEIGVDEEECFFDDSCKTEDIINTIERLNADDGVDGILVQLPLYKHLNQDKILNAINPNKDVDGFHPINLGKLISNQEGLVACTPRGIMTILSNLKIKFEGKYAVVIGRSIIVGKPMAAMLINQGATVTVCHSKTKDISKFTKKADIVIVATGIPGLISKSMVKRGSTIIDVGINRVEGKTIGDVLTEEVKDVAKYVTPVPGGVGLTTVLSLIENVIDIAKRRYD